MEGFYAEKDVSLDSSCAEKDKYSSALEKLTKDIKLVILDAIGTFIPTDAERKGLRKFLKYCSKNKIEVVVATDQSRAAILKHKKGKLVARYASDFYTYYARGKTADPNEKGTGSASYFILPENHEYGGMGVKDLARILNDLKIPPEQAVMIGDMESDIIAAKLARTNYVMTPADKYFDFTSLIPKKNT